MSILKIFGPSQWGRTVMVRSPWVCRRMTAYYPYNFKGTAWAASSTQPCNRCARAMQLSQEITILVHLFLAQATIKFVRFCTISARFLRRCPCGDCSLPPTTCLRATSLHFIQICQKSIHSGYGARKSVRKSHGLRRPPHGGRKVREIRASYELPQSKCDLCTIGI